jgi:hypothetical protein
MFQRIKDQTGNPMNGLLRSKNGSVVVENPAEYQKYMKDKELREEMSKMRSDIDDIRTMLEKIAVAVLHK